MNNEIINIIDLLSGVFSDLDQLRSFQLGD